MERGKGKGSRIMPYLIEPLSSLPLLFQLLKFLFNSFVATGAMAVVETVANFCFCLEILSHFISNGNISLRNNHILLFEI